MKNLILLLFIFSCSSKETTIKEIAVDSSNYFYDTVHLQNKIIEKGDIYSYKRLEDNYEYSDSNNYNLLKYSYIMAARYNYKDADYKIIRDIIRKELKSNDLSLIDDLSLQNKKEILFRLNQCIKNNNIDCIVVMRDHYKKTNNKNQLEKMEKLLDSIMYK